MTNLDLLPIWIEIPDDELVMVDGEPVPPSFLAHAVLPDQGLDVRLALAVENGAWAVNELLVRRLPDAADTISKTKLGDVEVSAIVDFAASFAAAKVAQSRGMIPESEHFTVKRVPQTPQRRWKMTDEHLREVADVYRDGYPSGTAAVADSYYPISPRTAARWVELARERGFLPPTTQGKGAI